MLMTVLCRRRPTRSAGFSLAFALALQIGVNDAPSYAETYPSLPPNLVDYSAVAYARDRQTAKSQVAEKDWAKAAAVLARLTGSFPYDGDLWHDLGSARLALGDFGGAAVAFVAAHRIGLGADADENAADAARAYAQAGNAAESARWLAVAIDDEKYRKPQVLLNEPVFDKLRVDRDIRAAISRFKAIASDASRARRLDGDLAIYLGAIDRYRTDLTSAQRDLIHRAALILRKRWIELGDDEVVVEFQRLAASEPGGHNTSPSLDSGIGLDGKSLLQLPIDLYAFPDGLYVVAVAPGLDRSLVGSRVTRFGAIAVEAMLQRVRPLVDRDAGSDARAIAIAPRYLTLLPVLHDLGATSQSTTAKLTFEGPKGVSREVSLRGGNYRSKGKLVPQSLDDQQVPLALRHITTAFWFTDLPQGVVYLQFNRVESDGEETISSFAAKLQCHLEEARAQILIVDARFNGGGDTFSYIDLLRTLVAFDFAPGYRLFYVEGRDTFSAAINFSADIRRLTHATIVGEPASAPRAAGDPVFLTLPNTHLQVKVSSNTWSLFYPDDTRAWIPPDMPVVLTAADYFANRDPVLEAILQSLTMKLSTSGRGLE